MNIRTLALLAVLLLVAAAAAWVHNVRRHEPTAGPPAAPVASRQVVSTAHPRIDDAAGILAPFGPRLGRMADDFAKDLGIDVHVVTTEQAGRIETQSESIFRERGIGKEAPTGGLLILLNPATKAARIEVGYSLEGGLTDLHMGRLARDQLAPYVSYASAGMAAMDVLHYLRDQSLLSAARGDIRLGEEFRRQPTFAAYQRFASGGAGAKTKLPDLPLDADLKRPVPAAQRVRYAPSADVEESVAAFLRATADLAGDPTLPLFTDGTQMMRSVYPFAPFEELKRAERIDASLPLEYRVEGDYAVATSANAVTGFVPVLLHREGGLWRVDQVETWKNLFFLNDGNYVLWNNNTPYRFGLGQFGDGKHYDIEPLPLGGRPVATELASLEGRAGALAALRRAEIWLRNVFVFPKALAHYEEARQAAPEDPLVLETIADRAMYLGFPELAIPALENAGSGFELELVAAWNQMGEIEKADQWADRALSENPFDLHAIDWKAYLAERRNDDVERRRALARAAELRSDRRRVSNPVSLEFEPRQPLFHPDTPVQSGGTTVHDHSSFSVTMTNLSARPVVVESVRLASRGTAAASGLGDVKDYWDYPRGGRRLGPGESVSFDKLWGFTVDTGHEHVRYVFRTCWHGEGESVRQCRVQWVDALP